MFPAEHVPPGTFCQPESSESPRAGFNPIVAIGPDTFVRGGPKISLLSPSKHQLPGHFYLDSP